MVAATQRVFSRIPGTDLPSMDGKRYLLEGFNVVKTGLLGAGWKSVTANNVPAEKNRTFCHTPYMYANGERGGPQATYLVTAKGRPNFKLWLNTTVEKIHRIGGHATGLNVKPTNNGGYIGDIKLTPVTGRVIISAGAFGTPKLLFRSGIGPKDQLDVVKASTDGPTMINSSYWIKTPVGYNLDDHLNTDLVISHPNVSYYDWPESWTTPIPADKTAYFTKRSGPFAQAAPNIGPIMFEEIKGPDGIVRQFQWQARVEGSRGQPNGKTMTVSVWLGRGKISRGRATISSRLNMEVTTLPFGDVNDMATLAKAIDNMVAALAPVKNLTWLLPPPGQDGAAYLKTVPLTLAEVGSRRSNHWIGTAKMGTDSGVTGGTSVVDTNTKVYGTDNIFVVDASIFPGMVTTNPSALIVTAAERASEKILALPPLTPIAKYSQCGGLYYTGTQVCVTGSVCTFNNEYYSQVCPLFRSIHLYQKDKSLTLRF
jgi:cellobiose dehydrogenase (acceptor)